MKPNQIQATRDILFIQRRIEDDVFEGSNIIRPDTHKMEMSVATVLSVGPDIKDNYAVGDQVYVGKLAGLKLTELGDGYFLVNHQEVLAKVLPDTDPAGVIAVDVADLKKL